MSQVQRALLASAAAVALVVTFAAGGAAGSTHTDRSTGPDDRAASERILERAELQTGPKHTTRPKVRFRGKTYLAANPYLAQLPSVADVDWYYWRSWLNTPHHRRQVTPGKFRSKPPTPLGVREHEPVGRLGDNDVQPSAERISGFGTDRDFQGVKVSGRLSSAHVPAVAITTAEDQGSIPQATPTGIGGQRQRVTLASRIGDGPHGRARDRHGDFDFFKLHAVAGQAILANTLGSELDTSLFVYDSDGRILDINDDVDDEVLQSALVYEVPRTADYYVMVAGFSDASPTPSDPFRSGSGRGVGDEGTYKLDISAAPVDKDFYGVHLNSGDVLGGQLSGRASLVEVHRVDGRALIGSGQDASGLYPVQSPLPGGSVSFSYVAEEAGWYAVSARAGAGNYGLLLEVYRPGTERNTGVQTVFLDFDGERLNTNIFGGPGVSTLSPLSSFLPRWGLTTNDNAAVVRTIVDTVKENIRQTLQANGLNRNVRVQVLNSRNHPDSFGDPNVSRVVVGGSIEESGIDTLGISQSIDPGNFAHEEQALVLLDLLSDPSGPGYSLNTYLKPGSDKVAFVGHALGNVISHEIGHFVGSFHTDNVGATANLMDAGGRAFNRTFGVGTDGAGGTIDDRDVDFGEDRLMPEEGFTGLEDTLNNSAWAFLPGTS